MAAGRRQHTRARKLAREVLWKCGIDEPAKIDPLVIAGRLGIVVIYGPLDGPTAQVFRHGNRAVMRVSDTIIQLGRRHFTISHELGHCLLGHQIPRDPGEVASRTPYQEREADVFAAELLMPEELVAPHVARPASLATVREIADTFRASIVAAGRRYVELTSAPCALVYSEGGHVVWTKHSRSFPGRIPPQIRIGAGTIASDHARKANALDDTAREVPASAWFAAGAEATNCASLIEHAEVVPEPGWGGVLSLLDAQNYS